MGKLILHGFSKAGVLHFRDSLAVPARENLTQIELGRQFPWRIFILNTVAVAILTIGVLSAVYASYINPDYRSTASNLSAFINGYDYCSAGRYAVGAAFIHFWSQIAGWNSYNSLNLFLIKFYKTLNMKHLLIGFTLLFCSLCLSAQTTDEEYNYITKGYAIQISSGLDMKKGYEFTDLGNTVIDFSDAVRTVTFKALIRTEKKTLAGIMMVYSKGGTDYYYCIPHRLSTKAIWDRCFNDIIQSKNNNLSPGNMLVAWNYALMKLSATLADLKIKS